MQPSNGYLLAHRCSMDLRESSGLPSGSPGPPARSKLEQKSCWVKRVRPPNHWIWTRPDPTRLLPSFLACSQLGTVKNGGEGGVGGCVEAPLLLHFYPTPLTPLSPTTTVSSFLSSNLAIYCVCIISCHCLSITYLSMDLLRPCLLLLLLRLVLHCCTAQPSPGYFPSYRYRPLRGFYRGFNNLWGPEHQIVAGDQRSVTIWLDSYSGSGFKSIKPFRNGYFSASIKLQPGYTAGVNTAFYLSNNQAHPGYHDEVDIEFLGTTPGKPYTLQTNVYVRGSGDSTVIGREMKFHLWFDPAASFHNYAILWNPTEIVFFVDDVPIRRYPRRNAGTYPSRPMWLYGSIWDASSWATEDGKYKADYRYQPFVARFTRFTVHGCSAFAPPVCLPVPPSGGGAGLSPRQNAAMQWAQRNYMVYNYCSDPKRDHAFTPECRS